MRYDHVVVGAGSAGAVLAARLSEDPARQVLLLEAGPSGGDAQRGASFFDALGQSGRTWSALVARRTPEHEPVPYLRGRGLGGSSAINAMVAIPGLPDDYERWVRLGAQGWGWRELRPWFARTALTLTLAALHERGPVSRAVLKALPGAAAAVPLTRDAAGLRASTADCYLVPARERSNLDIRGDALVDRVLLDGRRACGVRLADGTEVEAAEVLLCAGAIHSPAVLARSGVDTPGVGESLKDHPAFPVPVRLREAVEWDPHGLAISVVGRLGSGAEPGDLQILPMDHLGPTVPRTGLVMVALMSVRSTGRVRLADADPHVDPVVDFDLLGDEEDERRLLVGVERLVDLLAHPALTAVGEAVVPATDAAGVRAHLGEYAHAACTCAMGRVVDSECRVVGYESLRVCDASVFPDLPRANPHLSVVVVAERLAAMIRAMTAP